MKMTMLGCGLLLAATFAMGCKPRVPKVANATAETSADGSVKVTHRPLNMTMQGPEGTRVEQESPTEVELKWGRTVSSRYMTVKAPDQLTPMMVDELKTNIELTGSSVRYLESKENEGGGFTLTWTYRNKKFEQMAGYYSVQPVGSAKVVCTYAGEGDGVRVAKGLCESIRPLEAAAVPASGGTIDNVK